MPLELPWEVPSIGPLVSRMGACREEGTPGAGSHLQLPGWPKKGLKKLGVHPSSYPGAKSGFAAGWQAAHHKEEPRGCVVSYGDGAPPVGLRAGWEV